MISFLIPMSQTLRKLFRGREKKKWNDLQHLKKKGFVDCCKKKFRTKVTHEKNLDSTQRTSKQMKSERKKNGNHVNNDPSSGAILQILTHKCLRSLWQRVTVYVSLISICQRGCGRRRGCVDVGWEGREHEKLMFTKHNAKVKNALLPKNRYWLNSGNQ